jgi:non-ribosomal peptide synthetase component F
VPVDPAYPEARIAFMLEDSAAPVLLAQAALLQRLPVAGGCQALCLDAEEFDGCPDANPPPQARPDSLAYVIYTSGSTGRPKGVMIEQRGVVNLVSYHQRLFETGEVKRVLQFASLSFDVASWEIITALSGGTRCIWFPLLRFKLTWAQSLKPRQLPMRHSLLPYSAFCPRAICRTWFTSRSAAKPARRS